MTNHIHLLVTPENDESISKVFQTAGRTYMQYFNFTYRRSRTLWKGRYRATVVDGERYLLTWMRYIELNSVRTDRVAHPRDYPWSSYAFNAQRRGRAELGLADSAPRISAPRSKGDGSTSRLPAIIQGGYFKQGPERNPRVHAQGLGKTVEWVRVGRR